jgi:DnaJ-class molecular chaperone
MTPNHANSPEGEKVTKLDRVSDDRLEELRSAYEQTASAPAAHLRIDRKTSDLQHQSIMEELQAHRDRICRECEGRTYIPNRAANYTADTCDGRYTGQYSTNDPEEVECPRCNGVGYEAPYKRPVEPRIPTIYDQNEEPF